MGIVNQNNFDSKPEWRHTLDRGEHLPPSQQKEMQSLLEENRKELGKIWDENATEFKRIGNEIGQDLAEIPGAVVNNVSSVVNNIKEDIKNDIEEEKQMVQDAYQEYRKQYDETVAKAKDAYKDAKETINKVKEDIKNLDMDKIKQNVFNGFSKFIKENLKDTLEIDVDNTEVPIVRQIYNKIKKETIDVFDKRFPKQLKYEATPNHKLMVRIGKNVLYDKSGCILSYTEIADYMNNGYTIRILEAEVPSLAIHKILSSPKEPINGAEYAYEILLSALPVTDDVFPETPIWAGKYVAVLKNTDGIANINEEVKTETTVQTNDWMSGKKTKLIFYLYKPDELKFQDSHLINFVLDNPKPFEIIMKAFELVNKDYKIMISNLENDVPMGKIVIPHMSFSDLIKYLDLEVGLYNTDYINFMENGIYYLLNTNDASKINAENKTLQSTIELFIDRHKDGKTYPAFIARKGNNTYQISVDVANVNIEVLNSSVYSDANIFIKPDGHRNYHENPLSRKTNIVRKITAVNPLKKDNTMAMEVISFSVQGFPIRKITPLTTVIMTDSSGQPRTYRVSYKEIAIESHAGSSVFIKAFRRIKK